MIQAPYPNRKIGGRPVRGIRANYAVLKKVPRKKEWIALIERTRLIDGRPAIAYAVVRSPHIILPIGTQLLALEAKPYRQMPRGRRRAKARDPEAWFSNLEEAEAAFSRWAGVAGSRGSRARLATQARPTSLV